MLIALFAVTRKRGVQNIQKLKEHDLPREAY